VIQRRTAVGLGLAVGATLFAGCGFQAPAETYNEHSSAQGADFRTGPIDVGDAAITSLQTSELHTTTYLIATIINDSHSSDTLTGVTSSAGTVQLSGSGVVGGSLTLPPGVPVSIDQPLVSPNGPTATIKAATPPALGTLADVMFTFADAGPSNHVSVPVVPPDQTLAPTAAVPQVTASVPVPSGEHASD
jgi:hypothetical protein